MDIDKAYSVDNGLIIDEDTGGPFYTGGTASPVGLDLPEKTFYLQTVSGGVLLWRKYGVGVNDWRQLSAQDIPFDPAGLRLRATDLYDTIKELREKNAYVPDTNATTLNGTKTLINTSLFQQQFTGTATGYSVVLPDATTMFTGERFELINGSSESLYLKNDSGTIIYTIISGAILTVYCASNATADGVWQFSEVSGAATGITSYVVTADTVFTTSSSTDVIITSFETTPVSGRYSVAFSADIEISQNNRIAQTVICVGGVAVENTRREVQGVSSNFNSIMQTIGEVACNGSELVQVHVNISSGSLDINQRSLILIRLGS